VLETTANGTTMNIILGVVFLLLGAFLIFFAL